jgi:hypothetical protein
MNERHLDFLYEHWGQRNGWMSFIEQNFVLSQMDLDYLKWRDDNDQPVHQKMAKWIDEIEREGGLEIYNEDDLGKKLVLVNQKINMIEMVADGLSKEDAFIYLSVSDLDKLNSLRYRIRNQILSKEMPDREVKITDGEIERAREFPLFRLISNLPKSHKILCPFHHEKSPSFHVGQWGYCFGCGAHSDSISWVIRSQGISFVEAVKQLNRLPII